MTFSRPDGFNIFVTNSSIEIDPLCKPSANSSICVTILSVYPEDFNSSSFILDIFCCNSYIAFVSVSDEITPVLSPFFKASEKFSDFFTILSKALPLALATFSIDSIYPASSDIPCFSNCFHPEAIPPNNRLFLSSANL